MNKIRLQDLTPKIYYEQSRDFQFIGRLFDVVLNSIKTSSENLYNLQLNKNTDERLIDLLLLTLGFKSKHKYNTNQLLSLCSALSTIIRKKGSLEAILIAVRTLLNSEGISQEIVPEFNENNTEINLYLPVQFRKTMAISLLEDLFDYILPAGMTYNIILETLLNKEATTEAAVKSQINFKKPAVESLVVSVIPTTNNNAAISAALPKDTAGLIGNTDVLRATDIKKTNEENN